MSARTLDDWSVPPDVSSLAFVLALARLRAGAGFTADDLRDSVGSYLTNPGAMLGSLCQQGRLRVVGEETARSRSSKGRRIRRFVLVDDPSNSEGGL